MDLSLSVRPQHPSGTGGKDKTETRKHRGPGGPREGSARGGVCARGSAPMRLRGEGRAGGGGVGKCHLCQLSLAVYDDWTPPMHPSSNTHSEFDLGQTA